jgi:membrane-anchored protein YejM (alkaline phosphatase superfamily)
LIVVTFSDVEVAHSGSYSLHLSGIRTIDRLVGELWNEVQTNASYKGKTTVFVLPEFGRDLDGSNTNGFFNHRQNHDSTRLTWMMCLGEAAKRSGMIERPVQHIDLCPTILNLFGVLTPEVSGKLLTEVRV